MLEADLQIVMTWRLEFKSLSRCIPKSFTDFSMETISVLIENPVGILSDLFLVKTADLTLSELTIILLLKNQLTQP